MNIQIEPRQSARQLRLGQKLIFILGWMLLLTLLVARAVSAAGAGGGGGGLTHLMM